MYQNDEIDVTGVGKDNVESVRDPNNDLNKEYHTSTGLNVSYIGFNVNKEPFNDPDVRRALAMAIDKDFLANNLYKGLFDVANGILPPEMPGYNQNLDAIKFDADAAKKLLDDTGKANALDGIKILTAGQGAAPDDILQAVTAMWQQNLGVTIEVEQEDFGLFLTDVDQGKFDMFSLGWVADYPDPQNFLELNFHTDNSNNKTGYSNHEVDGLLQQATAEKDTDKRIQLYQQAEQIIVNEEPWIPLIFGKSSYLVKPYVTGYEANPFVISSLRYVSVDR
jgi:oligopeptide transport system substrate-binding protein